MQADKLSMPCSKLFRRRSRTEEIEKSEAIASPSSRQHVSQDTDSTIPDRTIHLDVGRLDHLMSLANEVSRKAAELREALTSANK